MRRRFGPATGVEYHVTVFQRLMPTAIAVLAIVLTQLGIWVAGGQFVMVVTSRLIEAWVAAGLIRVLYDWDRFGVRLTATTLEVHSLRRRTIPWTQVRAIRVERTPGSRTVVVYEAGGRRTRLRAPITGILQYDRQFDEKFHAIDRWWRDHRGLDQTPLAHDRRL